MAGCFGVDHYSSLYYCRRRCCCRCCYQKLDDPSPSMDDEKKETEKAVLNDWSGLDSVAAAAALFVSYSSLHVVHRMPVMDHTDVSSS